MTTCSNCKSQYPDSAPYCSSCGSLRKPLAQHSYRGSMLFGIGLLALVAIWKTGSTTADENVVHVAEPPALITKSSDLHTTNPRKRSLSSRNGRNATQLDKSAPVAETGAMITPGATPARAGSTLAVQDVTADNLDSDKLSAASPVKIAPSPKPLIAQTPTVGVLGVSGANWIEGGFSGVEILEIAPQSPADIAGLHTHEVITDISGQRIQSVQDLAVVLSRHPPGSRITLGYIFKSNLGWMPKESLIVLAEQ